jgi:hypothetical protein
MLLARNRVPWLPSGGALAAATALVTGLAVGISVGLLFGAATLLETAAARNMALTLLAGLFLAVLVARALAWLYPALEIVESPGRTRARRFGPWVATLLIGILASIAATLILR